MEDNKKQYLKEGFDIFIEECKLDIADKGQEDNHCIILYITKSFDYQIGDIRSVNRVYKSVDEFEKRGFEDINNIDVTYGVTPQLWFFD